ncbi:WD repeat and FYVE domain containing 3, partial [Reticulomyxa filosa]
MCNTLFKQTKTGELEEIETNLKNKVAFTTSFEMSNPELGPLLTIKKIRSMLDYVPSATTRSEGLADLADKDTAEDELKRSKTSPSLKDSSMISSQSDSNELEQVAENKEPMQFTYDSLREVYKRQYQLQQIAIEFFLFNGSNFLLVFPKRQLRFINMRIYIYVFVCYSERDAVFEAIQNSPSFQQRRQRDKRRSEVITGKTATNHQTSDTFHHIQAAQQRTRFQMVAETLGRVADNISVVTKRWENGQLSNFAYLMFLNTLAGRSYNDITQYPVFPWILRDYDSDTLNLNNPVPMGAQTEPRASEFKERYETWEDPTGKAPPWHYGSHYSCAAIVLYFLIRLEPFTKFGFHCFLC